MTHEHAFTCHPVPAAMEEGDWRESCVCGRREPASEAPIEYADTWPSQPEPGPWKRLRREAGEAESVVTEDDMLTRLMEAAAYGGWLFHHVRRSDQAITMGSPGFPDVLLCHRRRGLVMAIELKAARGRFRPGQTEWWAALQAAGVDARIVRPPDLVALEDHLLGDRLKEAT